MSTDMETAFAAIRWQHIRTVESMQALTERNVELEREVFNHAQARKAEKLKRKKAFDELKAGTTAMFRQLRGELEVSRTLVYTQSKMCYNDSAKIISRLGLMLKELQHESSGLKFELQNANGQIERLQLRLVVYEDELSGDLKAQLASMRNELQAERARSITYENKYSDSKKRFDDKLAQAELKYRALDGQYQNQTRKFNFMEAEHVTALNGLREEHEIDLSQKDGEIAMLKQFLSDRDKKIEYLLAELDKAKAQTMGGSSFKKYVQLKTQNVELQNEVESLAKQVGGGKGQARGGRRAVSKQVGAAGLLNPASLVGDSITSDFADERGNAGKGNRGHASASFASSHSASSRRRGGGGVDPSMLSPAPSSDVIPLAHNKISSTSNLDTNSSVGLHRDTSRGEDEDTFGHGDNSFGPPPVEAYKAPRRRREPTGFAAGLPINHQGGGGYGYNRHEDKSGNGSNTLVTSSSLKFSAEDFARTQNAQGLAKEGSLSARASVDAATGPDPNNLSPSRHLVLRLSPRSPRTSPDRARPAPESPPHAIISHSPRNASYDPADSLFPAGNSPRRGGDTELGVLGTNNNGSKARRSGQRLLCDDSSRDSSKSPSASPRRHFEYDLTTKSNKLTFV